MARVFKFAQKEYSIRSELISFQGQDVDSFTYNDDPVLTSGNYGGAEQIQTVMTGQTLTAAAAATALLFSNTLSPVSTHGVTVASNVITLTEKGEYLFKLQAECDIGCTTKVVMVVGGSDYDSSSDTALAVAGGNVSVNHVFVYPKTTTGSTTVAFTIQGDSATVTGTNVVIANTGEVRIVFYPSTVQ